MVDTTRSGGGYCSLAFDGAGQPAFSYYDAWNADLKFAHYNGSKWQTQTVASKNSQGLYANLYFAPASLQARIVYYNRSGDGVYLATGNIGSWTFQQLASGGGSSVAATPGVSQDCTFAWMQTATGRLVIEDW